MLRRLARRALCVVVVVAVALGGASCRPPVVPGVEGPGRPHAAPKSVQRPPVSDAPAGNWAQFRGPSGTGAAAAGTEPAGTPELDLVWQSEELLPGKSGPVLWDEKVFVTGATARQRMVYCFSADRGRLLWQREVPAGASAAEPQDSTVGFAAPTPATDGKRVYALFSDGTLAALSTSGRLTWTLSLDLSANSYGHAGSPVPYAGRLLLQLDQEPADKPLSRLLAVDCTTGKTLWDAPRDVPSSWSTPLPVHAGERDELVTCGGDWVISYSPETGRELWRAKCLGGEVVPSATFAGGLVVAAIQGATCAAIRPGGEGDVTAERLAWTYADDLPEVCSPVVTPAGVVLLASDGTATCLQASTGKRLWRRALGEACSASPVARDNRVFVVSEPGTLRVLDAANGGAVLAQREVPEGSQSTPAIQGGRVYIRGDHRLYCVGAP